MRNDMSSRSSRRALRSEPLFDQASIEAAHARSAYRDEWTRWAASAAPWTHFVTLTTIHPASAAALWRMVYRYLGKLQFEIGNDLPWVCVLERTSSGQLHAHMLIGGTERLSIDALRRPWGYGISSAAMFDSARGGVAYIGKYLDAADAEMWSFALPTASEPLSPDGAPTG